jgi:hypothetical protein
MPMTGKTDTQFLTRRLIWPIGGETTRPMFLDSSMELALR